MCKESKRPEVSRRDFLKGVAAGSLGIATMGILGGCSSDSKDNTAGVTDAPANSTTAQNTVNVNWPECEPLTEFSKAAGKGEMAFVAEPIADSELKATEEVDVVICGIGPAGYAASIACAQKGLKTVAVEKAAGGTWRSATMGGLDDRIHKKYGVEFDKKQWLDEAMVNCSYYGNQEIYQTWLDTHEEAVNWFFDQLGVPDDQYHLTFAAGDFPDFRAPYDETSLSRSWNSSVNIPLAVQDIKTALEAKMTEAGVEFYFNTPAVQLVKDENNQVIGVIVKKEEGYVKYLTQKGVVLCTGGYEYNEERLKRCCRPRDLALSGWMNGTPTNTGDGHEMGVAVGAMEDEYPHALMLDPSQLMPYLRVNKLGKRFTAEYEPYNHLALAIQAQPEARDFYITDANAMDAMGKMWTPSSSCYGPKEIWVGAATSDKALKADSIEELAGLMGVPADNLKATIDRWNEMCDAGEDSEFHFKSSMMHRIDTAPFYANPEGAEALCTAGGLQITAKSEVINQKAEVIPGLYAVGNVSGSMFHGTYPHNLNALSHSRCVTFGYNIAKTLVNRA